MIRGNQDIDNKRTAGTWSKKRLLPQLLVASKDITSKQQLFDAIKESITGFTEIVYGSNDDLKYRKIIDLIMLRMKSDFNELPLSFQIDESSFHNIIDQSLQDAYDENDADPVKFNELADSLIANVKILLGIRNSSEKQSDDYERLYRNERKASSYNALEKLDHAVNYINDMILKMSFDINEQFSIVSSLISSAFNRLFSSIIDITDMSSTVDKLNRLQLGNVQSSERKTRKKLDKSGVDINVAGMKMSTKIFDSLSTDAMKSAIYFSAQTSLHYSALKDQIRTTQQFTQEHVDKTNKVIDSILKLDLSFSPPKGFISKIIDFIKKFMWNPLKKLVMKCIKGLASLVVSCLKNGISLFIKAIKLAFRGLKYAFKMMWRFMKSLFSETIKMFKTVMKGLMRTALATLKTLWRMIWWTLKASFKAAVFVMKWAWKETNVLFKKIKNSKFGKKIGKMFTKVKSFFTKIGSTVKSKFPKAIEKWSSLKNTIKTKLLNVKSKLKKAGYAVKNKVSIFINSFITKCKKAIQLKVRKVRLKLRRAIMKIPGAKFIRTMSKKIGSFLTKKAFKKRMKDGVIRRIIKGLAKKLGKFLGKMGAKVLFGSIAGVLTAGISFAITWGWMMHDIMSLYKDLQAFFKPAAETLGYDTSRPAWFVSFLWEQQMEIKKYLIENYAEFLSALREGLNNALYGTMNKLVILAMYNNERHVKAKLRWAEYQKILKTDYYTKIGNVPNFLKILRTHYKMMIHTAVQLKKLNEEIAEASSKMGSFDFDDEETSNVVAMYWHKHKYEEEISRVFQEKFKQRMDYVDDFIKHAIMAGMFRVFPGGTDESPLARYVANPWPEEDTESFLALYNEAYAGISYIDFLLNRKKTNERLKESIKEQEAFHKTAYLDVDKLKEALKKCKEDEDLFYATAEKVKKMIMSEGMKISEQIDKMIDENSNDNSSNDIFMITSNSAKNT